MVEATRKLEGRTILLVEDDLVVALALSTVLEQAGADVVGPISTPREAVARLEKGRKQIDAAILDVDLNGEKSYAVPMRSHRGASHCSQPGMPPRPWTLGTANTCGFRSRSNYQAPLRALTR
jgi:response regulator RpfG family c-di-GMP phosphodiesterase